MADKNIHSTGRGGAGNIGQDSNTYVDGDIVREGIATEGGSHGRGGAGNIRSTPTASPALKPQSADIIPESATRTDGYEDFHTGRGGAGNEHKDKYGGHSHAQKDKSETLLDKAKHAVGLDKK